MNGVTRHWVTRTVLSEMIDNVTSDSGFGANGSSGYHVTGEGDELAGWGYEAYNAQLARFMNGLFKHREPFTVFLIVMYVLCVVLGLIGNVFVISVVLQNKHMRTVTNMFLVNLAVGDLLVVMVCMPFSLAPSVYNNWIYGTVMCKLSPFVQGISVSVSVFTLFAISVDRLIAIQKPMKARILFSKKRVTIIIAAIWLLGALIALPMLLVNEINGRIFGGMLEFQVQTCQEQWKSQSSKQAYTITLFSVLYLLPLLCMTIAYAKIGSILWSSDGGHAGIKMAARQASIRHGQNVLIGRRKVVRMLIVVAAIFAASWLPYYTVNMYLDYNQDEQGTPFVAMYIYPIVQWIALANSTTNPICYCFMSANFRDAFIKMFTRCCGACTVKQLDSRSGGTVVGGRVCDSADTRLTRQKIGRYSNLSNKSAPLTAREDPVEDGHGSNPERTHQETYETLL